MADFEGILYKASADEIMLVDKGTALLDEVLEYGIYVYNTVYVDNLKCDYKLSGTVLGLLFREAIEVADGIRVLFQKSCSEASLPLVRTLIELFSQITVIAQDETERSANAYRLCALKKSLEIFAKKLAEGEWTEGYYQKELEKIEGIVASDAELKLLDERFKKLRYPKWFNLLDEDKRHSSIHSMIRHICEDDGSDLYDYSSYEAHGFAVFNDLLLTKEGKWGMRLLRHPDQLVSKLNLCITILCRIYELFIERYLKAEDQDNIVIWFKEIVRRMEELRAFQKVAGWQSQ